MTLNNFCFVDLLKEINNRIKAEVRCTVVAITTFPYIETKIIRYFDDEKSKQRLYNIVEFSIFAYFAFSPSRVIIVLYPSFVHFFFPISASCFHHRRSIFYPSRRRIFIIVGSCFHRRGIVRQLRVNVISNYSYFGVSICWTSY